MDDDRRSITIPKIEAARRQLDCAIALWFLDKDDVSVHTLAAAAHEIIHDICGKKGVSGELMYDTPIIKDEYRSEWRNLMRKPMTFFKHADRDPEGTIEFRPHLTLGFFLSSIRGLGLLSEKGSDHIAAFQIWVFVNKPTWINEDFRERALKLIDVEGLNEIRRTPKSQFLDEFLRLRAHTHANRFDISWK